jgi:hypothetical protein
MVPENGLVKALVMSILCLAAYYWGWHSPAPRKWLRASGSRYRLPWCYAIGAAFLLIGVLAFLRLASLSGGIAGHFSIRGNYALEWRGWPVVYAFFMDFLPPGLALTLLTALRLKTPWRFAMPAAALLIPLAYVVILGRRGGLVELGLLLLCVAYFARRWAPTPKLILAALPFLALAMFLAPQYRTYSQLGADREKLRQISPRETASQVLSGQATEFYTIAYSIHVTDLTRTFELGVGFYNTFIAIMVPKLIVGEEAKQALFIGTAGQPLHDNPLGWEIAYGMAPGGPSTAYRQFWFFGCLWFYVVARFLRYLYLRSIVSNDLLAQVFYIMLVPPSVAGIVADMYCGYNRLIVFGPLLWALAFFLRRLQPARGDVRVYPRPEVARVGAAVQYQ